MSDKEITPEAQALLDQAAEDYAKYHSEETKAAWNEALGNIHATIVNEKDEGTA
jgi:putative alpha-1,2-mannosidase